MTRIILSLILTICLAGCVEKENVSSVSVGTEQMRHSAALSLQLLPGGSFAAVVRDTNDSTRVLGRYFLDNGGTDTLPQGFTWVSIPVKSAVIYTQIYATALREAGNSEAVKAVVDAQYFTSPEILEAIASGKIAEAGTAALPSVEKITEMSPDAVLLSYYKGMESTASLEKAGIPLLYLADNLETTPLGRAEWLKFFGALSGTFSRTDSIFDSVERNYLSLRDSVAMYVKDRSPRKVLIDNIYQGIWYVSGGKSYQAALFSDAWAVYPWKEDESTGSLNLQYEQVLDKAGDADVWMIRFFGDSTAFRNAMQADSRYKAFAAYKSGIWVSDTSKSTLFDDTAFHPDKILAEYVAIIYPELFEMNPVYFKNIRMQQ